MLVKSKVKEEHLDDLKETFNTLCKYNMKLNPTKCVFRVSSGNTLIHGVTMRDRGKPNKVRAILELTSLKMMKEVQSLTGKVVALNQFVSQAADKCLLFFKTLKKDFEWTDECGDALKNLKASCTTIIAESIHYRRRTLPLPNSPIGRS